MNHAANNKAREADLHFQKGFTAHHACKLDEAEKFYRKALKLAPNDVETVYFLGTVCVQREKFDEGIGYLNRTLELSPEYGQALNSLGLAHRLQNKFSEAEGYYRRALASEPDFVEALSNLGSVLEVQGKLDEAQSYLLRAMSLSPGMANVHFNLGLTYFAQDKFEQAARYFQSGLQLQPDYVPAYSDLARIFTTWGRQEQALECIERALTHMPDADFLHNNRGAILESMGRLADALAAFKRSLELNPNNNTVKWNTAYLYLRQGVLDLGWEVHEMRLEEGGQVSVRFPFPPWDGSSLKDKTILVYAEQGVGDEIFYASCIPDLIAQAGHCIIECDARLAPLYQRSFPTATVIGGNRLEIGWVTNMPQIDVQSAVGSLPRFLRKTLDSFPEKADYLVADAAKREYWRSRLSLLGPGPKIGICWRSGLTKGIRHRYYSRLDEWGDILTIGGVHFVNLQYDESQAELTRAESLFGISIANFTELDMIKDLDGTAALISSLDLVITAGTAVSELSGSLGVPTFRIDPFGKQVDALGTSRIPWHPATTSFSQASLGDWKTPIALIAEAVTEFKHGAEKSVDFVGLSGGAEIAVEGIVDALAGYVLHEQGAWFDPEYDFVMHMAAPGMRMMDAGAGAGVYAIPLAARLGNGKLWAMAHAPSDLNLMMRSRARNKLESCLHISSVDRALSLDAEMDKRGLDNMDFVRVSTDAFQPGFVARSTRFLSVNSPLLMFGIQAGAGFNGTEAEQLRLLGYGLYRMVPGLSLLVPFAGAGELDVYALNLFACKPDRAQALAQQGLLISQTSQIHDYPGIDQTQWQDFLRDAPYASALIQNWLGHEQRASEWEVYWMGLNLYAQSQSATLPMERRYACLQAASGVVASLVGQHANLPRLLSLVRILIDLGRREMAVNLLNQVCQLLSTGMSFAVDEPFLALDEAYAASAPGERIGDWLTSMILEQRESLRAFTSFFTGTESLEAYQEVQRLGFGGAKVSRRIELIMARAAHAAPPATS